MRHFPWLVFFLCFPFSAWTQGGMLPFAGGRLKALGNNGENFRDIHALFFNQAGLAYLDNTTTTLGIENRFLTEGLTQVCLGVAVPTNSGTFGISLLSFGNPYYRESQIGLAYARKLADQTAIGAKIGYQIIQIIEGGHDGVLSAEIGLQHRILPFLHMGAHILNPIAATFANGYQLPSIFRIGAMVELSEKVSLLSGIDKSLREKENIKIALEYLISEQIQLRMGLQSHPRSLSFGFGSKIRKNMQLDFASSWHPILGISPAFQFNYTFAK